MRVQHRLAARERDRLDSRALDLVEEYQAFLPCELVHHGRVVGRHEAVQAVEVALARDRPIDVREVAGRGQAQALPRGYLVARLACDGNPALHEVAQHGRVLHVAGAVAFEQREELVLRKPPRLADAGDVVRARNELPAAQCDAVGKFAVHAPLLPVPRSDAGCLTLFAEAGSFRMNLSVALFSGCLRPSWEGRGGHAIGCADGCMIARVGEPQCVEGANAVSGERMRGAKAKASRGEPRPCARLCLVDHATQGLAQGDCPLR